jgi:hypothetical protein
MLTTYATLNTNITRAIRNHLIEVDALPPTMALAELASEIADVVFTEMDNLGLTRETINSLDKVSGERRKTVGTAA